MRQGMAPEKRVSSVAVTRIDGRRYLRVQPPHPLELFLPGLMRIFELVVCFHSPYLSFMRSGASECRSQQ